MDDVALIEFALNWSKSYFKNEQIVAYLLPIETDDEPEARLITLAIAGFTSWQGCEVWQEPGETPSIYDVGECIAPDEVDWPW